MSVPPGTQTSGLETQRLLSVAYAGPFALACLFAGGIYLASYLPHRTSLVPAVALLAAAALLVLGSVGALARAPGFAWRTFWLIARWVALAYGVIAGMLEYMFVRNGTRGAPLVVMTLMLAVFALTVTVLISYTVARQDRSGT
jgi:hypothetical protein